MEVRPFALMVLSVYPLVKVGYSDFVYELYGITEEERKIIEKDS